MSNYLICVVIILYLTVLCASENNQNRSQYQVVYTNSGPIRGQLLTSIFEHKTFYSFKGIPYAVPPKNELRFLPPIPVHPWNAIKDSFDFGNVCYQYNPINKTQLIGDEDCLFLNVYTQDTTPVKPKSVMVYIHGGGFFFGSGNDDLQGPDLLINEDVVLVTLNYRVGVLGFMSLGTPEYSGNQGLKDQQLALIWINKNIHLFGGNKDQITLFGQSAGSSSSHFHILAPGSQGLFKQTIEISYTFDMWSIFEKGDHMQDMFEFAVSENQNVTTYEQLVHFLKTTQANKFPVYFPIIQYYPSNTPIIITSKWLPVVENSKAKQPFMQLSPADIMLERHFSTNINIMAGYTNAEGLFFGTPNIVRPELLSEINNSFAIELPSIHFNRNYNSSSYSKVAVNN